MFLNGHKFKISSSFVDRHMIWYTRLRSSEILSSSPLTGWLDKHLHPFLCLTIHLKKANCYILQTLFSDSQNFGTLSFRGNSQFRSFLEDLCSDKHQYAFFVPVCMFFLFLFSRYLKKRFTSGTFSNQSDPDYEIYMSSNLITWFVIVQNVRHISEAWYALFTKVYQHIVVMQLAHAAKIWQVKQEKGKKTILWHQLCVPV